VKDFIIESCVICYYVDFVNPNVDNVGNVMHLLVLWIPCFINSRLSDILEKSKNKFVIKHQN